MSSKLEPVIWLRDTGHIGIHEGADGRTYVRTFMTSWLKTKFSHIDGLPYFLSYGAPRARSSAINRIPSLGCLRAEAKVSTFQAIAEGF